MAHAINRLVEGHHDRSPQERQPYKVLACCGAAHMAYGFGVPERVFAAHPELRTDSYSLYAFTADSELTVLGEEGLREVFGAPGDTHVADVAFVFEDE